MLGYSCGNHVLQPHLHQKDAQKEPGTAVANLNYNTRQKATVYVGAGGGLSPSYGHIRRVLEDRENRIRKDGRVIEKFIIALPREMTMEQSIGTVHKFGFRLTRGGQAPYYFSIQDWNTHNPHVHFVLIDQHRETGKTVAKAWERNSTHRFKRLWQDVANDDMAALGIDARIDFDAAEEKAQALREQETANDNLEPAREAAPLSTDSEIEPPAESVNDEPLETEDADDGDDEDMALLELTGSPLENVLEAHRELETLENAKTELTRAEADFGRADKELAIASHEAGQAHIANEDAKKAVESAAKEFRQHLKPNGRLKGFSIGIGGLRWASQARTRAELAAVRVYMERSLQERQAKALQEHQQQVQRWENAKADYARKQVMLANQLLRYSNRRNQDYAENLFKDAIRKNMEKLSLEELRDLYEKGELSEAKYRHILHIAGAMHELDDLDEETGKNRDRSEGY